MRRFNGVSDARTSRWNQRTRAACATLITDADLKHLAKIKSLKSLNLTECQLSEAALDDLQDTLPWCRIIR